MSYPNAPINEKHQPCSGFELGSPLPFPTTITIIMLNVTNGKTQNQKMFKKRNSLNTDNINTSILANKNKQSGVIVTTLVDEHKISRRILLIY